jgi:hypothetical protein
LDKFHKRVIIEVLRATVFMLSLGLLAPVSAKGPAEVAVDFLEKARDGKLVLESADVMVVSPHITAEKREWIAKSIERLSGQIGSGTLAVSEVKLDGDFAAVMVRQAGGDDPFHVQVFPVALLKGETGWRAAPVPASFENAVVAYTVPIRERLSKLEEWMMRQRVVEMESLMQQVVERLRADIRSFFLRKPVSGLGVAEVFDQFQKAYQQGNQLELLGYMGGYSEPWPEDWESRFKAIQMAFQPKTRERYPWRLLGSKDVLRIVVNEETDGDRGLLSVVCLDPSWERAQGEDSGLQVLHFEFQKDAGGTWVIELPGSMTNPDENPYDETQGMDGDLLDRFPKYLRKACPAEYAGTVEEAERRLIQVLQSGGLEDVLRRIDLSEDPVVARKMCEIATRNWWSVHAPGVFRIPVVLGNKVKDGWAVSVYQWVSLGQGERFEPTAFYFKRTANGWMWVPGPGSEIDPAIREEFSIWMAVEERQWRENSGKRLMEGIFEVDRVAMDQQVDAMELKALLERWIGALEKKDIRELFTMSARLGGQGHGSHKILRNLAYLLGMAQRSDTELAGIYRAGGWVAAGLAHGKGKDRLVSLMLVVRTDAGLKVLSEIDLISEDNRTRKFLNKVSFDRLRPYVREKDMEELGVLFEKFDREMRK